MTTHPPPFFVAVVNDRAILRCPLCAAADAVSSDFVDIPGAPVREVTVMCYTPNLIPDQFPGEWWHLQLQIDSSVHSVGLLRNRLEILTAKFRLPEPAFRSRLLVLPVSQRKADDLAGWLHHTVDQLSTGSITLSSLAAIAEEKYPDPCAAVLNSFFSGSFESFIRAYPMLFSLSSDHLGTLVTLRPKGDCALPTALNGEY